MQPSQRPKAIEPGASRGAVLSAATGVLAVLLLAVSAFADVQRVEIVLDRALVRSDAAGQTPGRDLIIQSRLVDGEMDWLEGNAPDYNRGNHRGRVLEGTLGGGTLTLEMHVAGDRWVPGGRAAYTLSLAPDGEGAYRGTYTGTYEVIARRGGPVERHEVRGEAVVNVTSPLAPEAAFTAPADGEHPRLLMRVADRNRLRDKARTPLGAAMMSRIERSANPVAAGLAYQVTGDADHARRIMPAVQKMLEDETPGAFRGASGEYGKRLAELALTYDLCYDAWPDEFREAAAGYIARKTEKLLFRPNAIIPAYNWNPNSNYSGHASGACALAGMALVDRRSDAPSPPPAAAVQVIAMQPDPAFAVADGVPVATWRDGRLPDRWLMLGPIANPEVALTDYLEAIGGEAAVRAESGMAVRIDGERFAFAPMDERFVTEGPEGNGLELMAASGKQRSSTLYFYTVLEVPAATTVQFRGGVAGPDNRFYLNGRELIEGDFMALSPGRYPLLVRAHLPQINPWGKHWATPRFVAVDESAVREGLASIRILAGLAERQYAEDLAYWKATGRSPRLRWLMLCGINRAIDYHRYTFGDGGFQVEGEGYTRVGEEWPLVFEMAHRNMFGRASTGRPDVSHFGPRYIAQTVYRQTGVEAQQSFSLTDGTLPPGKWAIAYAAVPESWRPAALWAWNQAMGVARGGEGRSAADRAADADFIAQIVDHAEDLPMTFLNYPLDLVPRDPDGILPHVWRAPTKGLYIFRNGWNDENDIVAQVFLKSEGEGGWSNCDAGSIRLNGLGHAWAVRGRGVGKTRLRDAETVVVLPDDPTSDRMRARLVHLDAKPDGSGSLTADMGLLYRGRQTFVDAQGQTQRRDAVDGRFRLVPDALRDLGIEGTRSFAIDFSGRSGAAALIVLADRIEGGGAKRWMWQLPDKLGRDQVSFRDDGFEIRQAGGLLRATFVRPAPLTIGFSEREFWMVPAKDRAKDEKSFRLHAIEAQAAGEPAAGDWLVVITLDRSAAPPVEADGDVELTRLRVGGQRVACTPDRIRFED